MRAFLAIKFYDNAENRKLLNEITDNLKTGNIDAFAFVRDFQWLGEEKFNSKILMKKSFEEIKKSDIVIVEASEPSIGIGIEACYAWMNRIPVYVIANKKAKVSDTIKGIANEFFAYDKLQDLISFALKINKSEDSKKI